MKRHITLIAVLLLVCVVFSGCNTYTTEETPEATTPPETEEAPPSEETAEETEATEEVAEEVSKTFTFVKGGDVITLDAGKAADNMSEEALYYTQAALMRNFHDTYLPDAAEDFEISDDGLEITFYLRDGLVWSDETPLTADDFVFGFLHLMDPESANAGANSYYVVKGAEAYNIGEGAAEDVGVSAPDEQTFVVELAYLEPTFYDTIKALNPIRRDYVEEHGSSYGTSPETYISSGPYIVTDWTYEQSVSFEKNPLYWDAASINITNLEWLTIVDQNAQLNLFDTGDADGMQLPSGYAETYADQLVISYQSAAGNAIQLNFSNPENPDAGEVLANYNFRKALSYAIDRAPMIAAMQPDYVADSRLVSDKTLTPSGQTWAEAYPFEANPVEADSEAAQQFLADALDELGYGSVDELPAMTFLLFEVPTYRTYAEGFLDAWNTVLGLNNIEISVLPIPQAIQAGMSGQFDLYLQGLARGSDPYSMFQMFGIGGAMNWGEWDEMQTYTDMLDATNEMLDQEERFDALFEIEKFFDENGYMIPLWSYGGSMVVKPDLNLTGYGVSTFDTPTVSFVYADIIPDSQR